MMKIISTDTFERSSVNFKYHRDKLPKKYSKYLPSMFTAFIAEGKEYHTRSWYYDLDPNDDGPIIRVSDEVYQKIIMLNSPHVQTLLKAWILKRYHPLVPSER